MGYRIEYDKGNQKYEITQSNYTFLWTLLVSFALFIFITAAFWRDGWAILRDMVIPGDDAVTLRALSDMSGNLRNGMELGDAIRVFCQDVLYAASHPY